MAARPLIASVVGFRIWKFWVGAAGEDEDAAPAKAGEAGAGAEVDGAGEADTCERRSG
jgi:hypothetical protein